MEIVMCTCCYELYIKEKIKNENNKYFCPKPNCNSQLVDIDEQIAIVIRLLNLKGYETLYCCSGHPGLETNTQPYIFFKAWSVPDTLPEGWEYDKFDRSKQCTITYDIEKIGYWQGLENLHKWVIALPKINNKDIEEEEKNDN